MSSLYQPNPKRYEGVHYARCGRSGLKLPQISLGLWHNFGEKDDFETGRAMIHCAFDQGIHHFDLANNYGPGVGWAERNFGKILAEGLKAYRDELIISTKAGYYMWEGPTGDWGSRKYMLASLDQSLKRMQLDYVDIFYSHRFDPETPLEETMGALDHAVRSGRALYAGISNYSPEKTEEAAGILRGLGTPCVIHQSSYNMLNRGIEDGLLSVLETEGMGGIVFCPLAQGLLTDKYLKAIPEDSRVKKSHFLKEAAVVENLPKIRKLNALAEARGQSLAQMAVQWVLRQRNVTSALIGASRPEQILDNLEALKGAAFDVAEIEAIDAACR